MDIVNPNYLNYMEQIQKNRKDIENLYDQELSDITQLNFKENDENGLDYENGKATFYGKSTIIRDENTDNLEVDSKVELKISSGDDDIVIDAGEDNSTLEIHLDNETRNKINRALLTPITTPNEREFVAVGTNNAQEMIPESELYKDLESSVVLYDKDSLDEEINKGYTAGIPFAGGYSGVELGDTSLFDMFRITCCLHSSNRKPIFYCSANAKVNEVSRFYGCIKADWAGDYICLITGYVNSTGALYTGGCADFHLVSSLSKTDYLNNSDYYISKIEGVKIR